MTGDPTATPALTYRASEKHCEPLTAQKPGTKCPRWSATRAQELLDQSEPMGEKRIATYQGLAFVAQYGNDGTWHGYPEAWDKIDGAVRRRWLAEGASSDAICDDGAAGTMSATPGRNRTMQNEGGFERFGQPDRFALDLRLLPDPDGDNAAPAASIGSWGQWRLWVGGINLTEHDLAVASGQVVRQEHVTWYLAPLLRWLATVWTPLLHEEHFPSTIRRARDARSAVHLGRQHPDGR